MWPVLPSPRSSERPKAVPATLPTSSRGDPELKDAILIGDPDYMLEPMHYYLPNRTYFVREQRYGGIVHFTPQGEA